MLFGHRKRHRLELEGALTVRGLLEWLCASPLLTDSRRELFVLDGTVRPGVLVLINDTDWELEGTLDYALQPRDHLCFVSTLHGG